MEGPCLGCEVRNAGCHSMCEKYILWKEEKQKRKDKIYIEMENERATDRVLKESHARHRKRRHR